MIEAEPLLETWRYDISGLPRAGISCWFEADERECKRIAERYGLNEMRSLTVSAKITRRKKLGYAVTGTIQATLVQSCVVTLKPVEETIDEPFERVLVQREQPSADAPDEGEVREVEFSLDDADPPEPFTGPEIDIGDIVLEEFALHLNPYPRHPDAEEWDVTHYAGPDSNGDGEGKADNPFAVLRQLKSGQNGE